MTTMNTSLIGAASAGQVTWDELCWPTIERQVRRLQMRIAKATREGRIARAKALQWILTHSFYGKCLAVKRVVLNKGSKTPGVDKVLWRTSNQRMQGVLSLKRRGYESKPLKRIYIPKKENKLRPLSIPTMKDRAMQSLWKLALEPICEEQADPNSYGFRPKRCADDAISQCHIVLSKRHSAQWILEGDIKSCFDKISHDWCLRNIPMDKIILGKFLKAGFMADGKYFPTMEGTPQGGVISPTLTVMVLTGLEKELKSRFKRGTKVNIVFYADDFIITGASKDILKAEVLPHVEAFLKKRGLELSKEKTNIYHIEEGFDFLGFNIRKYKNKLLTKPSKARVKTFLKDIRGNIKFLRACSAELLIHTLNPKIRGWAQYFKHASSSRTFAHIDFKIYESLAGWVHRRHSRRSRVWALKRYFKSCGLRNWVFSAVSKSNNLPKVVRLVSAATTHVRRYVKIKGEAHPYNPNFTEYLGKRGRSRLLGSYKAAS